ncbi:MAG: primosomal protein N' [Clostridiales bacterium]|nr:primosomal protein N' [Clostridiales bacterium]
MVREFAAVRILDAPYHADQIYDYYIPAEFSETVFSGSLVSVPFGRGNRHARAVVTEVRGSSAYENTKPILSVTGDGPLLNEEMLGVCRFLCDYTLCTFGEAVRTVIPAAAMSKMFDYYSAAEGDHEKKLKKLSEKALLFYSYIKARGEVSAQQLKTKFGDEAATLAASLVKSGVVTRQSKIKVRSSDRFDAFISPVMDSFASIVTAGKLKSPLQAQILVALSKTGRISAEELFERIGVRAKVQLNALEKKQMIHVERVESYRNPYAIPEDTVLQEEMPLSVQQQEAYDKLEALYASGAAAALLHGVTGSGKTRVIKEMIDRVLQDKRGVIVLVPEISLTPQVVEYFCKCYGNRIAVIHSKLSAGERYDAWKRIRKGLADVVIGTRSAIFAPIPNIGMIVIDEEQEHTYKSDTDPKYLAHDVARYRCGQHNALLLLSSATPSLSSYYKAMSGIYTLIEMQQRYGKARLPDVAVCDMRSEIDAGNTSPISIGLLERLKEVRDKKSQAIIFLNRRGYSSAVSCRVCGEAIRCPNCSVSLTYHTRAPIGVTEDAQDYFRRRSERGDLACHYCGYRTPVPSTCPSCGAEHFRFMGCGTQQAQEEIERLVPGLRVLRMDMDTTQTKMSHRELIENFREGGADVLLGTQMVTKGHDFPHVTLVGVMNADGSLYLDDFRAAERTFSMLTQAIGRAGRANEPGIAVVQTYNPDSPVIRMAAMQDYKSFYEREIPLRQALVFPPFCDIAVVTLCSSDEALLAASAAKLAENVKELLKGAFQDVEAVVFGPFETPIYRVQNVCRMRLVIKCRLNRRARKMIGSILAAFGKSGTKNLTISADLNPSSL